MGEQAGLGDALEPPCSLEHLKDVLDSRGLDEEPRPLAVPDGGKGDRELEVGAKGLDDILALVLVGVRGLRDDLGDGLE